MTWPAPPIRPDCRPQTENEVVIEVLDGPNHYGQYSFIAYWNDDYLPPSGVRGQIFLTHLREFVERTEQKGSTVRIIDRRQG